MSDLWTRLRATAASAAESAARAGDAALERAQAVSALAAETAARASDAALERAAAVSVLAVEQAGRVRERAARVGEQAAARAGELAAEAAGTLGDALDDLAHAERRAELANRVRALLVPEDETVYDVAGERDVDLQALGITPQLLAFASDLSFPHELPTGPQPPPPLTRWQEAHAQAMLAKVPKVAELRYSLCPRRMTDAQFWQMYFLLCGHLITPEASAATPAGVQLAPPGAQEAPTRAREPAALSVAAPPAAAAAAAAEATPVAAAAAVTTPASAPPAAVPPATAEPAVEDAAADAKDGDGALEEFLQEVLRPGGTAEGGADADEEEAGEGDDAALEEEFAALLRGDSGSSASLESVSEDASAS